MKPEHCPAGRPDFVEATADPSCALCRFWPLVEVRGVGFARRVANCQADVDDMIAEAMETLWKLGPERYDGANVEDVHYITTVLIHRMSKVWGGGSEKKQAEAEQAVRAMIGSEVLLGDDQPRGYVESRDLLDDALLNAQEFGEIIAHREDVDELLRGDEECEAA